MSLFSHFKCIVCLEVATQPKVTCTCMTLACAPCAAKLRQCPQCRAPATWTTLRGQLLSLYEEFSAPCDGKGCGVRVTAAKYERHVKTECLGRPSQCKLCGEKMPIVDLVEHGQQRHGLRHLDEDTVALWRCVHEPPSTTPETANANENANANTNANANANTNANENANTNANANANTNTNANANTNANENANTNEAFETAEWRQRCTALMDRVNQSSSHAMWLVCDPLLAECLRALKPHVFSALDAVVQKGREMQTVAEFLDIPTAVEPCEHDAPLAFAKAWLRLQRFSVSFSDVVELCYPFSEFNRFYSFFFVDDTMKHLVAAVVGNALNALLAMGVHPLRDDLAWVAYPACCFYDSTTTRLFAHLVVHPAFAPLHAEDAVSTLTIRSVLMNMASRWMACCLDDSDTLEDAKSIWLALQPYPHAYDKTVAPVTVTTTLDEYLQNLDKLRERAERERRQRELEQRIHELQEHKRSKRATNERREPTEKVETKEPEMGENETNKEERENEEES